MPGRCLSLAMFCATLVLAGTARGRAAGFNWFGPPNTEPLGLSADGLVATGKSSPGGPAQAFRWTTAGGMQFLGTLGGNHSQGTGISASGAVIVGFSDTDPATTITVTRAFRWSSGGMSDLGTLGGHTYSVADDVSADGSVAVGISGVIPMVTTYRAVKWNAGGIVDLGVLPGLVYSHAYGISDDGSTAVGFSAGPGVSRACRWRDGMPVEQIGTGIGVAFAASANGDVVVGDMGTQAFRWTAATGVQLLGVLPGHSDSHATGVSADGSVVVGYCSGNGLSTAFRWVVGGQMQSVFDLLTSYGVTTDACTACSTPWDISADGKTIVGFGCYPASGDICTGWIATLPLDSDGDGLLDVWENSGIDGDGDGDIDVFPADMGADPQHKDIFVEVDEMSPAVALSPAARALLVQAFAAAPLSNPDGQTGIALHLITDPLDVIRFDDVWFTDSGTCWPVEFSAVREAHFGNPGDSPGVKGALARFVHYCVAVQAILNSNLQNIGGCGQLPGRDFVCALGGYSDEEAAAVFMHELGHNLGLNHGGADGINGKPNYVSIMNYPLSYRSNFSSSFWRLDFSRSTLPVLFEFNLNEAEGLPAPAGFGGATVRMPFGFDRLENNTLVRHWALAPLNGAPINWDGDTIPNENGSDVDNTDLNYAGSNPPVGGLDVPSPNEVLNSHDDWANIQLALPGEPGIAGAGQNYPANEPPHAPVLVAWLNANVPPVCVADIDHSSTVNVNDLLAVINAWGACPAPCPPHCAADISPVPAGDCAVNVDDLLAVINAWGPCP